MKEDDSTITDSQMLAYKWWWRWKCNAPPSYPMPNQGWNQGQTTAEDRRSLNSFIFSVTSPFTFLSDSNVEPERGVADPVLGLCWQWPQKHPATGANGRAQENGQRHNLVNQWVKFAPSTHTKGYNIQVSEGRHLSQQYVIYYHTPSANGKNIHKSATQANSTFKQMHRIRSPRHSSEWVP